MEMWACLMLLVIIVSTAMISGGLLILGSTTSRALKEIKLYFRRRRGNYRLVHRAWNKRCKTPSGFIPGGASLFNTDFTDFKKNYIDY